MEKQQTIKEMVISINKRLDEISKLIQKALSESPRFAEEYENCNVYLDKTGADIMPNIYRCNNQEYVFYNIYAQYIRKGYLVFFDDIYLTLDELDDDAIILEKVSEVIEENCRKKEE